MELGDLSYEEARTRFLELAKDGRLERWEVNCDDRLSTDIAILGNASAENLLVLSSGLHGVEGAMGSRAQLYWLEHASSGWLQEGKLENCAVILMHALNPFGFRHSRRANEDNFDLNRAFHEIDERPQEHQLFTVANRLLAPQKTPSRDGFLLQAIWSLLRYDRRELGAAIAAGQFSNSQGLFYGGTLAPDLQTRFEKWFEQFVAGKRIVEHFDLHSGLGPFGKCQLMLERGISQLGIRQARSRWPSLVSESALGETAYEARGTLGAWLQNLAAKRGVDYRYYCAEFGTYSPIQVLSALRKENQAWFYLEPEHPHREAAAKALRACFDPPIPKWRKSVCEQTRDLVERVLTDFGRQ